MYSVESVCVCVCAAGKHLSVSSSYIIHISHLATAGLYLVVDF